MKFTAFLTLWLLGVQGFAAAAPASAQVTLTEPISANVFVSSLKEQTALLEQIFTHPEGAAIVDHHRMTLRKEGKFLMVKSFTCRASRDQNGCDVDFQYGQLGVTDPSERLKDYGHLHADLGSSLRPRFVVRWEDAE